LESSFIALSKQLPASIVDNTLHIPSPRGSGLIKNFFLEDGLYMRYTRLRYYEDIEVIRLAKQADGEIIFALSFLLTPESFKLVRSFMQPAAHPGYPNNVFLTSNNTRLSTTIPEGILSHTIELLFSKEWLHTHLAGMEEKIEAVSEVLSEEEQTSVITERTQPAEDQLLSEIEFELNKPLFNLLTIRSRALTLLANIINRLPGRDKSTIPVKEAYYVQAIKQVEQRLMQSLQDMLPSQKQLAKEFALSESTLKRHFKAIYGKTMYEYYLEKKMDLAKSLLQEKRISVSETAYRLGYEKVSAFIIIFKKYHKVLPGSLK
jgi:AraC-like DNA-binding protein